MLRLRTLRLCTHQGLDASPAATRDALLAARIGGLLSGQSGRDVLVFGRALQEDFVELADVRSCINRRTLHRLGDRLRVVGGCP